MRSILIIHTSLRVDRLRTTGFWYMLFQLYVLFLFRHRYETLVPGKDITETGTCLVHS